MYNSLRTDICLHVRNYFLNILLSEDMHIFVYEELLSECTNLRDHTSIYMWGTIFWVYYSLRHAYIYMWRTIFWVYYSLRRYMHLLMRKYFLSVLLSEDIHIFTCEELLSECTNLWEHTSIYMWGTIFWVYYSLRNTYIYMWGTIFWVHYSLRKYMYLYVRN